MALKTIGINLCSLVWTCFYDDFVSLCRKGDELQTERMIRRLFDVLGWTLSSHEAKDRGLELNSTWKGFRMDSLRFRTPLAERTN